VTIRPQTQQVPSYKPQRLSGLSLGIAAALMSLAGASQAAELKLENGWSGSLNTTVSVGTSIRAQEPDSKLYRYKRGVNNVCSARLLTGPEVRIPIAVI
jgi:DNA mismatch repair protein MutH